MPDNNGTIKGQAAPPALPVDELPEKEKVEEMVKLPPTPEERLQLRLETAAKESDDDRAKRRDKEFGLHVEAHKTYVAEAHAAFPAPLHRNWEGYTDEEKKNYNERGRAIASANKAYHLAVRRTFDEHLAEDRHVKKLRDDAAKKENV
jgi:hypothetical protein